MNFEKLAARVFWREQAFATLESSWSGAVLAFWDNAANVAAKSVGKSISRRFTLTLVCLGAVLVGM
jgi:hypothetical protein